VTSERPVGGGLTTRRSSTGLDTEVFVMNQDGTGPTNITNSADVDADPHVR